MATYRVKTTNADMYVAEARAKDIVTFQTFSCSGAPALGSQSGRFFPRQAIDLEGIVISSRTEGDSTSTFAFKRKAPYDPEDEWTFFTQSLSSNEKYYGAAIESWTFDATDWINVECTAAGGHEDIVISFTGKRSSLGYVEL